MNIMTRIASFLIALTLLLSCTKVGKGKRILGEWKCVSWTSEASATDNCNSNVYFQFNEDRTYISEIGPLRDSGDYKIVDGDLYLQPIGKMEFAVRITSVDSINMMLLMNRAGVKETLVLEKK